MPPPMASETRKMLVPPGYPQPYQVRAFSAYFQASASLYGFLSLVDMVKAPLFAVAVRAAAVSAKRRLISSGIAGLRRRALRACRLRFEAPAMFHHRRGRFVCDVVC